MKFQLQGKQSILYVHCVCACVYVCVVCVWCVCVCVCVCVWCVCVCGVVWCGVCVHLQINLFWRFCIFKFRDCMCVYVQYEEHIMNKKGRGRIGKRPCYLIYRLSDLLNIHGEIASK